MKTREQILDRINKLLAMARDGSASESEVLTSLKIARSLMTRHGIEEHELRSGGLDSTRDVKRSTGHAKCWFASWERLVARAVGNITDTQHVLHESSSKKKIVFYGVGSDPEIAARLYRALLPAVRSSARTRGFSEKLKTKRKAYRDYCLGFALGLIEMSEKLQKLEAESNAIVVLKSEVIAQHLDQLDGMYMKPPGRAPRISTRNFAFHVGRVDGRNHDLGREKLQPA